MGQLKVTQIRSQISAKPKARGTLRALGLRRIGHSNVLPDRPEIRGMIARVPHLVAVEEIAEAKRPAKRTAGTRRPAEDSAGAKRSAKDSAGTAGPAEDTEG
jgi:large subunit ribosomal protein L30